MIEILLPRKDLDPICGDPASRIAGYHDAANVGQLFPEGDGENPYAVNQDIRIVVFAVGVAVVDLGAAGGVDYPVLPDAPLLLRAGPTLDVPLLLTGDDFAETDIKRVV